MFRSGDSVKHKPTGETWVLAFGDLEDGRGKVAPAGWPACLAEATDCEIVEAANDQSHRIMLEQVAAMRCGDFRRSTVREYMNRTKNPAPEVRSAK